MTLPRFATPSGPPNEGVGRGIVTGEGAFAGIVSTADIAVLLGTKLNQVSKPLQTAAPVDPLCGSDSASEALASLTGEARSDDRSELRSLET